MKCLILAGGAGNRLWPISRKNYPKQFVFLDGKHSLFQETINRNMSFCDEFWIISSAAYQNIIQGQLSYFSGLNYRCFYEEEPRRTAAALLYCAMIAGPGEEFLVVSSDSVITADHYMDVILQGREMIRRGDLVCVGSRTEYPALGIGFLSAGEQGGVSYSFPADYTELEAADHNDQLFWDSGILMGRSDSFCDELQKYCPSLYAETQKAFYRQLENDAFQSRNVFLQTSGISEENSLSIGQALTSRSDKMKLLVSDIICNRLINLEKLEMIESVANKELTIVENSGNVTVSNLTDKRMVIVNGAEDLIVVNTEDATYISRKGQTDHIKEILSQDNRSSFQPFFEDKPQYYTVWGLKETLHSDAHYWVRRLTIYPGKSLPKHMHNQRSENWTIIAGRASIFLDGNRFELTEGHCIHIERGRLHQLSNHGDENLVILETAVGELSDTLDDIGEADLVQKDAGQDTDDIVAMTPCCKETLWGGTKLRELYGKMFNGENIAETWEVSAHPSGQSIISSGMYAGIRFGEYLERMGKDILGWKSSHYDRFPLLVKFIDARESLSVQVHPDDDYALRYEHQYGKNEMWYVMEAEPGACLYCGFEHSVSKEEIEQRIHDNTLTEIMRKIYVHPGETYFIPAGTVHAIGKGVLVCEVQQNSDVTYRLYDFGRTDKYGNQRELHIRQGLAVLNPTVQPQSLSHMENTGYGEVVCNCKYFTVTKYVCDNHITIWGKLSSFTIMIVTKGQGHIRLNNTDLYFKAGSSFFIPAKTCAIQVYGKAEILTAVV